MGFTIFRKSIEINTFLLYTIVIMSYLPPWKRTALQTQLLALRTQYTSLQDTITSAISSGHISEIEFDSGEGKQKTKYRSLKQLQAFSIILEGQIESLENRLNYKGLVNLNLNR